MIPPGPASTDDYPLPPDRTDPLTLLTALVETYGPTVRCPTAYGHSYLFNRPESVKHVLTSPNFIRTPLLKIVLGDGSLTTDGPPWKQRRKLVQPAFQHRRVEAFVALMNRHAEALAQQWEHEVGRTINVDSAMMQVTLRIAAGALFGQDIEPHVGSIADALEVVVADLGALTATMFSVPAAFTPDRNRKMKAALAAIDRVVFDIVQARRQAPRSEPEDLLDRLLWSRDDDGRALTDTELRDEVVTMLVAGHETTATTLSWAWHLLDRNPDFDRRWRVELSALGDRPLTFEEHQNLPLTDRLFRETLRLYPPVWVNARKVIADDVVDGYAIDGGCAAFISPYTLHRAPEWWANPNRFDPDRFEPGRFDSDHRQYAYVPFARGPHTCTGHYFATLEGRTILAVLGRRFRLRGVGDPPVKPAATLTLRVQGGLPMVLEHLTT